MSVIRVDVWWFLTCYKVIRTEKICNTESRKSVVDILIAGTQCDADSLINWSISKTIYLPRIHYFKCDGYQLVWSGTRLKKSS